MESERDSIDVGISVVVPAYKSEASLPLLIERLQGVLPSLADSYEVILVSDGSPDNTWDVICDLASRHPWVRGINLMRNCGQHNATMCGLKYSTGRLIVTMDDDLQHPPEEIPKLLKALKEYPPLDAVFGVAERREHTAFRNIGSSALDSLLGMALDKPKDIRFSSFRLMTRELRDALAEYKGPIITVSALISQTTRNIANIEVAHARRKYGKSNYSLSRLFAMALSNIFNFSSLPLRLISYVGFASALVAVAYAAYVIYSKLTGRVTQAGFPALAVLISFFSGLILFSLGVLGQYIMRIMGAVTSRMPYVVRELRNCPPDTDGR